MRLPFPENSAALPSGFRIWTRTCPGPTGSSTRMPSLPAPRSAWQMRWTRGGVSGAGSSPRSITRYAFPAACHFSNRIRAEDIGRVFRKMRDG